MARRDDAHRGAKQALEQFRHRLQPHTGPVRSFVEADHSVPTRIEREIPAGGEHAKPLLMRLAVW